MTSQMTTLFVFQVKFCGCFCLLSALLCVVVTVTTTVVHMNRYAEQTMPREDGRYHLGSMVGPQFLFLIY